MVHWDSSLFLRYVEASIMAKQVKPPPTVQAPHMNADLSPDCSTFNPASYFCTWESRRWWPKCPGPCHHKGNLDEAPGSVSPSLSLQLFLSNKTQLIYSSNGQNSQGWVRQSQEPSTSLGLPCGWQGPKQLSHPLLPSYVYFSRELDWK